MGIWLLIGSCAIFTTFFAMTSIAAGLLRNQPELRKTIFVYVALFALIIIYGIFVAHTHLRAMGVD
jgi:hypothetical protein